MDAVSPEVLAVVLSGFLLPFLIEGIKWLEAKTTNDVLEGGLIRIIVAVFSYGIAAIALVLTQTSFGLWDIFLDGSALFTISTFTYSAVISKTRLSAKESLNNNN